MFPIAEHGAIGTETALRWWEVDRLRPKVEV